MSPAGGESLHDQIVRLCLEALACLHGPPVEAVRIEVRAGQLRIEVDISPEEAQRLLGPRPPPDLSTPERRVLEAMTAEPQTAKAIARRAGYSSASYVRAALKALERRGLVARAGGKYRLA